MMVNEHANRIVVVGGEIPEMVIPLTATRIVASAIATSDYEAIHHDKNAAERIGRKDVFLNILAITGFFHRYVTDWLGPRVRILSIKLKLGRASEAGEVFRVNGRVTSAEDLDCFTAELIGRGESGEAARAAIRFRVR